MATAVHPKMKMVEVHQGCETDCSKMDLRLFVIHRFLGAGLITKFRSLQVVFSALS